MKNKIDSDLDGFEDSSVKRRKEIKGHRAEMRSLYIQSLAWGLPDRPDPFQELNDAEEEDYKWWLSSWSEKRLVYIQSLAWGLPDVPDPFQELNYADEEDYKWWLSSWSEKRLVYIKSLAWVLWDGPDPFQEGWMMLMRSIMRTKMLMVDQGQRWIY